MRFFKHILTSISLFFILVIGISGCSSDSSGNAIHFSANFESGNLPLVTQLNSQGSAWEFALRDDNNNPQLPNSFRTWWYFRADHVPTQQPMHIEFTRLGFPYYFVPIYSYDQKTWQYFDEKDVTLLPGCDVAKPETCRLIINKQFDQPTVWMARTFPYTTKNGYAFLESIANSPYVQMSTLGKSPHFQKPLELITIADPASTTLKQTIWIHARTHPAETGPSFILEGLIGSLLAENELGKALRQDYIFKIVPMHNLDGIILGNYRTNFDSINLENNWLFTEAGNPYLSSLAPQENRLINQGAMVSVMQSQTAPIALALNLHSSNSDPDTGAFFFPHFGSGPNYSPTEQRLWQKQLAFIKTVALHFDGRIEQPPTEGGKGFLNSYFPETWWWTNKADTVNAMTLETTYGRAGFDHWVTENDLRSLGVALARSFNDMNTLQVQHVKDMSMFRLPFKPEIYERVPE